MHTSRMVQTTDQLLDTLKHSAFAILPRRAIKETLWSTVHFLFSSDKQLQIGEI